MDSTNFYINFESDVPEFDNEFKAAAKMRLRSLAVPHREIDHATVVVTKSKEGGGPAQFQARVTVYTGPDGGAMTVTKEDYRIVEALDAVLAEVEQKIHEMY